MKILLCLLCLGLGAATYYYYSKDQQDATTATAARESAEATLNAKIDDLNGQVDALKKKNGILSAQLTNAEKALDLARSATVATPIAPLRTDHVAVSPAAHAPANGAAVTLPDSITTLSGHTYTGCHLSRVDPDGISFTHSLGVAKVPFTDLDPTFAAAFHYDSASAQAYQSQEEKRQAESEALRDQARAKTQQAPATEAFNQPTASQPPRLSRAPGKKTLPPEERDRIEAEIQRLKDDIRFMQQEEDKLTANRRNLRVDGGRVSRGGYADKIIEEQRQLNDLQAQLSGG